MGLHEVIQGKSARILRIDGGLMVRKKLLKMGIVPGIPVKVLQKGDRGPMLLSVLGNQLAIGEGMARKVVVG